MARFYLSANNYRKDKLNWFGTQEGTFKVAIAGDGTPFGKDDQALAWLLSFLNCGQRVYSSAENFLLIGASCSEDCEPVRRYVVLLERQMTEIEGKMISVETDGKKKFASFQFELLPNDMKYIYIHAIYVKESKRTHRFSVTLSFAPKRSSDRKKFCPTSA